MRDGGDVEPAGKFGVVLSSRSFHLALIIVLGFIVYANSFHVPFIFDDQDSIFGNQVIRSLANFFSNSSGYEYNPGRYIGYLSFALNYRLGGLDVTGYHCVNLAVHLANAMLVYALVLLTCRSPFLEGSFPSPVSRRIALFAGLLFVVHPVQTHAVTYIVQRLTSLMTLFFLLAMVLYAWLRVSGEGRRTLGGVLYVGALAAVVLAMKTKENAFTLPVAIALYECLFFRGQTRRRVLLLLPFMACLLIIPFTMLNIGKPAGEVITDVSRVTQNQALLSRPEYLFTQFRVIVTYLRLLVFPVGQTLDYDYPFYRSMADPPVLASFLFLLGIVGGAAYLLFRSRTGPRWLRLVAFGIFWFFLTLAVESSVIPIVDVIYEHRVYLPFVGVAIATATFMVTLAERLSGRVAGKWVIGATLATIVLLGAATIKRNEVWGDSITFWRDVVSKSPNKSRGYNNLGLSLADTDRKEEAIPLLQRAVALDANNAEAFYNLGRVYLFYPDRVNDAIPLFQRALELKPDYDDAAINLAAAYIKLRKPAEAEKLVTAVIARDPDKPAAHFNLGVAYCLGGDLPGAERELAMLRRLDPLLGEQLEQFISRSSGAGGTGR